MTNWRMDGGNSHDERSHEIEARRERVSNLSAAMLRIIESLELGVAGRVSGEILQKSG